MRTYIEVEQAIHALPGVKAVRPYSGGNFFTPEVVGFIPIARNIKAEISYGKAVGADGYAIGFTMFENEHIMAYAKREPYDKCFADSDINEIPKHVEWVKARLMQ